jgi:hypothetical protein
VYVYADALYKPSLYCVIRNTRSLYQLQVAAVAVTAVAVIAVVTVTVATVTVVVWHVTLIDHASSMSRTYSSA